MDDFQQDFMRKVQNPPVKGEIVDASGAPKKPIDKRWFIIGALILVLVGTFITLLIISNNPSSNTGATLPQGDEIKDDSISDTSWSCEDGAQYVFDANSNLRILSPTTTSTYTYKVEDSKITFGQMSASVKGDTLTVLYVDKDTITCQKDNS